MQEPAEAAEPLGFTDHLHAIRTATDRIVENLANSDPQDPVPTCPDWSVRELIAHQGEVHRWATHAIATQDTENLDVPTDPAPDDGIGDWLAAGAGALLQTLQDAPDDVRAFVFLKNAPPPKRFWARRQAHETAIHGVDSLAGRIGRIPTTKEAAIDTALAVDGLDELLTGFVPRRSTRLRSDDPLACVVAPTDADAAWTVRVSADPPVVTRGVTDDAGDNPTMITGSAAALYLGLWNRGDDIAVTGETALLGLWRDKLRIRWG